MKTILVLIFPVIFSIAFFTTIDTDSNSCGWMGYLFTMLAYILLALTPLAARFRKGLNVLNYNMWAISIVYFVVTLVTNLCFLYLSPDSKGGCMLLNLAYILIYVVVYCLSHISNKGIENNE